MKPPKEGEEFVYKTIMKDNGNPSEYNNIKIYNSDMEIVYEKYPLVVEEAGYYYVNLATAEEQLYFYIMDTGLEDIMKAVVTDPHTGTVEGHTEGKTDYNSITFPAVEYERIMLFDITKSEEGEYETLTISLIRDEEHHNSFPCLPYNSCYVTIPLGEELELRFSSTEEFSFTLQYDAVSPQITTQDIFDIDNMEDINYYDDYRPLEMGGEIANAYFLITVNEPGEYKINVWCRDGNCYNIEYELYTLDGEPLEKGHQYTTVDESGTYIVKMIFDDEYISAVRMYICNVQKGSN